MSAKVLAQITEAAPWGITADETVFCSHCKEPIVHDGERWTHIRTGLSADWRDKQCRPLCQSCGQPATRAIGGNQFVGSGIRFVIDHFLCTGCLSKGSAGTIDHIS